MKLTTEQRLVALCIGDATPDARRLILAGLSNQDEETIIAGYRRAASIIGIQAAFNGLMVLAEQMEAGMLDLEDR